MDKMQTIGWFVELAFFRTPPSEGFLFFVNHPGNSDAERADDSSAQIQPDKSYRLTIFQSQLRG
jgi:hypothetical protein